MTVTCSACSASFPVDPNKIPERGVKVRCSVCANIFRVERPAPAVPEEPPVEVAPEPASAQEISVEPAMEAEAAERPTEDGSPSYAEQHERGWEEQSPPAGIAAEETSPEAAGGWEDGEDRRADAETGLANEDAMPDWASVEEPAAHPEETSAWEEPETEPQPEAEPEPSGELEPQVGSESTAHSDEEQSGGVEAASEATGPEITPEPTGWADARTEPMSWAEPEAAEEPAEAGPDPSEAPLMQEPETAAEAELGVQQPEAPVQGFTFGKRDPVDKARRLARVLVSDMVMYNSERHQLALSRGSLAEDFAEEIDKSWKEFVEQVGPEIADGEGRRFWKQALNDILAKGAPAF